MKMTTSFMLGKYRMMFVFVFVLISDNHILHDSFLYSIEEDSFGNCMLKGIHRSMLTK